MPPEVRYSAILSAKLHAPAASRLDIPHSPVRAVSHTQTRMVRKGTRGKTRREEEEERGGERWDDPELTAS